MSSRPPQDGPRDLPGPGIGWDENVRVRRRSAEALCHQTYSLFLSLYFGWKKNNQRRYFKLI